MVVFAFLLVGVLEFHSFFLWFATVVRVTLRSLLALLTFAIITVTI